jgi:uncharacterized protein
MSLEFRPAGVSCNIRCRYCYEESTRQCGEIPRYNKEAVWKALTETTEFWSLFGGEALIVPIEDIGELLELAYTKFGRSGIQTNGNLITPAHIDLFDKYHTNVGISVDGPDELNDIRWAGTLEATRRLTAKTEWAIEQLCLKAKTENKPWLTPSIIATLHAGNINPDKQDRFIAWLHHLEDLGVQFINLHVMELDFKAQEWNLPLDEQIKFLLRLWDEPFTTLKFQKFDEILNLLRGHDQETMCVWHACDPWNTSAVQGLEGDGSPSHCTRTNKDGKGWLPANGAGVATTHAIGNYPGQRFHERQLSLYVTPQEYGGCKDCRWWLMCQGQCPGTGDTGDWRLRSSYCDLFKGLFTEGERRLIEAGEQPVSLWKNREQLEAAQYAYWSNGQEASMHNLIAEATGALPKWYNATGHGDHSDSYRAAHGDVPHGDSHGDHFDLSTK